MIERVRSHAGYAAAMTYVPPVQPLWQLVVMLVGVGSVIPLAALLPFVVDRNHALAVVFAIVFDAVLVFLLYSYVVGWKQRRSASLTRDAAQIIAREQDEILVGGARRNLRYSVTIDRGSGAERFEVWSASAYERTLPGSGGVAYFRGGALVDYRRLIEP